MIDEANLLALLNSAPVRDGQIVETLHGADAPLRELRDHLQSVIRGQQTPGILRPYLAGIVQLPEITPSGVDWALSGAPAALPAARLVLEWARVHRELPGRLRACANPECNKFLIDHSRPNTARWCSMAECGNRLKARRHHARQAENEQRSQVSPEGVQ
jgi:hypothetical protein